MNGDTFERAALERIDRARGAVIKWIVVTGVVEAVLLVAFLLLADFGDRTHVLLLIGCLLVYGTLGFGLVALGAFTRWWALRILRALESMGAERMEDGA